MLESSLIMLQTLRTPTLLIRDSSTGFFCKICEIFNNILFYRPSPAAASDSFRFPDCNFIKKEAPAKMFFREFDKIFKNIFWQNTSEWLLPVLSVNFLRSFWEYLFYRLPMGNCLFHVQVAEFQPPDTIKNYFTSAFQPFYTRTRSSHSKAFIYLKSLKIICEEVNL